MESQLSDLTNIEFIGILGLVLANSGKVNTKTKIDLRTFYEGLRGDVLSVYETWEPFVDEAYDELLDDFSANLHKEAKRRFIEYTSQNNVRYTESTNCGGKSDYPDWMSN